MGFLMKYILHVVILGIVSFAGFSQAGQEVYGPHESEVKLTELASLPQGLTVTHTPESVATSFSGPSGVQWTHSTTVSSTVGPVKIVEYGFFLERNGRWTDDTGIQSKYTANDFEKNFDSPGAELLPGKSYTNEWNRSISDNRPEQAGKWYFIGVDAEGNRVKGEANIKLVGDMTEDGC
jgi:hypothetical protein